MTALISGYVYTPTGVLPVGHAQHTRKQWRDFIGAIKDASTHRYSERDGTYTTSVSAQVKGVWVGIAEIYNL